MPNLSESADRTTHFEIVNNPDVGEFLSDCVYMVEPTNEEAKEIAALFSLAPICDKELPINIISIDGSNYEASINENMPLPVLGMLKLGIYLLREIHLRSWDILNSLIHLKWQKSQKQIQLLHLLSRAQICNIRINQVLGMDLD